MIPPVIFYRAYQQTGVHTKTIEGLRGSDLLSGAQIPPETETFAAIIVYDADPSNPRRWLTLTVSHRTKGSGPDLVYFQAKTHGRLAAKIRRDSEIVMT